MGLFEISLATSAWLCALVAGFLFAFASVVMPGIQSLNDRECLRAFQAIDGVIQRNQLLFLLVWVGSVFALLISVLASLWHLEGLNLGLITIATATYLLGVQLPTATINIPLNNWLQNYDLTAATDTEIREARKRFEVRWIKWNRIRTLCASLVLALLVFLLLRL